MKKLLFPTLLLLLAGCQKQVADADTANAELAQVATDEITAEAAFSDVYNNVAGINDDIAITSTDIGADQQAPDPLISRCYTVSITPLDLVSWPKTVVIDFGSGCTGRDGRVRKGKILTVFSNRLKVPGAEATTTFDGYYVDDVHVEGTHVIKNNSNSTVRTMTRTVINGKLSKSNGNTIAWNALHTDTQTDGLGTPNFYWDDQYSITGDAQGQSTINGNMYEWTRTITTPLEKKATCRWFDAGIVLLTHNKYSATLDFGTGTCDNAATITYNNFSKAITLP